MAGQCYPATTGKGLPENGWRLLRRQESNFDKHDKQINIVHCVLQSVETKGSAMFKKFWLFGPLTGFTFASIAALIFTMWDWLENPGGIFRDANGTNWNFVYDTAVSWFVPTFITVAIIASAGHILFSALLLAYRKRLSAKHDRFNT
ncbi:hypothetical protein [Pseudohongiella sp. O18]|uniref:hypothetical protein n=1 Tax=Pseudohongiella sp. O18 TaxID=2904248 RepID=UPI001F203B0D|nr:hypothetical protein [Pseudohongiella sp. O18]